MYPPRRDGRLSWPWPNIQLDPRQQLANTPPPQSTTPGLHPINIHLMALPQRTSDCSLLLIYRPRKDGRLSWLVYAFTERLATTQYNHCHWITMTYVSKITLQYAASDVPTTQTSFTTAGRRLSNNVPLDPHDSQLIVL